MLVPVARTSMPSPQAVSWTVLCSIRTAPAAVEKSVIMAAQPLFSVMKSGSGGAVTPTAIEGGRVNGPIMKPSAQR